MFFSCGTSNFLGSFFHLYNHAFLKVVCYNYWFLIRDIIFFYVFFFVIFDGSILCFFKKFYVVLVSFIKNNNIKVRNIKKTIDLKYLYWNVFRLNYKISYLFFGIRFFHML